MPKAVIPIQLDLPAGHPLLSANAGEAQAALSAVERAVDEAIGGIVGAPVEAVATWVLPGVHRRTVVDPE